MIRVARVLALVVSMLAPFAASAHDFWIEPSSYRPAVGDMLQLDVRVGEFFAGDAVPRKPERIVAFVIAGPSGIVEVEGAAGDVPAGHVFVHEPGTLVVGYRSNLAYIVLAPDRFDRYLLSEGLDAAYEARRRGNLGDLPGREAYSRCAKALVSTREPGASVHDVPLGLTFELIAQRDPRELKAGDDLSVLVLLEGLPLAGALVVATPASDHEVCVTARSDAKGLVSLRLERAGPWIIHSVTMRPAPVEVDADWESLWASLTFSLGE